MVFGLQNAGNDRVYKVLQRQRGLKGAPDFPLDGVDWIPNVGGTNGKVKMGPIIGPP